MTIKEILTDNWDKLSPQSRENLEQAEVLIDHFIDYFWDDYSSVVLPLFKALERELYEICINKYYKWAHDAEDIDEADDKRFQYVNNILAKRESFALGQVVQLIIAYLDNNNIYKIKDPFKKFLDDLPSAKKDDNSEVYTKITYLCEEIDRTEERTYRTSRKREKNEEREKRIALTDYRNSCAHGSPNGIEIDMNAALDCLYRVPEIIKDLMEIF